jgi:hypothetical protein
MKDAMKAQRGRRSIVILFKLGARWGWVVNATHRPFYPRKRDPVPAGQDAKNISSTGIGSPDHPALKKVAILNLH